MARCEVLPEAAERWAGSRKMMRQPWLLAEGVQHRRMWAWRFDIALVNRFVARIHTHLAFLSCCLECVGHRVRLMGPDRPTEGQKEGRKNGLAKGTLQELSSLSSQLVRVDSVYLKCWAREVWVKGKLTHEMKVAVRLRLQMSRRCAGRRRRGFSQYWQFRMI